MRVCFRGWLRRVGVPHRWLFGLTCPGDGRSSSLRRDQGRHDAVSSRRWVLRGSIKTTTCPDGTSDNWRSRLGARSVGVCCSSFRVRRCFVEAVQAPDMVVTQGVEHALHQHSGGGDLRLVAGSRPAFGDPVAYGDDGVGLVVVAIDRLDSGPLPRSGAYEDHPIRAGCNHDQQPRRSPRPLIVRHAGGAHLQEGLEALEVTRHPPARQERLVADHTTDLLQDLHGRVTGRPTDQQLTVRHPLGNGVSRERSVLAAGLPARANDQFRCCSSGGGAGRW